MPNSGKPKKISYLDNLKKEFGQRQAASDAAGQANYKARYGVMGQKSPAYSADANAKAAARAKATGQLMGALLQGRRYDDKTGAQIKEPSRRVGILRDAKTGKPVTAKSVKKSGK